MSNILSKKHIGYVLGAVVALSFGALALTGIHDVNAQALTKDELFGGTTTGSDIEIYCGDVK